MIFKASPNPTASRPAQRVLLLGPADTPAMGGARRFYTELGLAMEPMVEVRRDTPFKPRATQIGECQETSTPFDVLSGTANLGWRYRKLKRDVTIDAVVSSVHWPPRLDSSTPMIGFVHDLRFLGLHNHSERRRFQLTADVVFSAIKSWDFCATASEHVADDIEFHLPFVSVQVIPYGVDHFPRVSSGHDRSGVVIVSGSAPHKRSDLGRLIAMELAALGLEVRTIGVPPGAWSAKGGIDVLSAVDDDTLAKALAECELAVFTTAYEGYGFAAGEALWQGTGVVYDRTSKLNYLVGSAGLAVDGTVHGFVEGVLEALAHSEILSANALELTADRTWRNTAGQVLDILDCRAHLHSDSENLSLRVRVDGDSRNTDEREHPYWSVIIPTYNRADKVAAAVRSVLAQSDGDLECIVIDDGSTDDTVPKLAAFQDSRLRVVSLSGRRGGGAARNEGIMAAQGSSIAFLDSDDFWMPRKLEECRRFIAESESEGLVVFHKILVDDGRAISEPRISMSGKKSYTARILEGEVLQTSGLMVPRELAVRCLFDEELAGFQDWDFVLRLEKEFNATVRIFDRALAIHSASRDSSRISNSPERVVAARRFMRKHAFWMSPKERARFLLLKQLPIQRRQYRNRRRLTLATLAGFRSFPLKYPHVVSLLLLISPADYSTRLKTGWFARRR